MWQYLIMEHYVATFPDGYKNSKNMCISDRAYKHIEDNKLTAITMHHRMY